MKFLNRKDFLKQAENSGCSRFVSLKLWNTRLFQIYLRLQVEPSGSPEGSEMIVLRLFLASHRPSAHLSTAEPQRRCEGVSTLLLIRRRWSPCRNEGAEHQSHRWLPKRANFSRLPQWLAARLLNSASSIRTRITLYFSFYLEWGVCFCLQECFALQGVFPAKNPKLSVENAELLNITFLLETNSYSSRETGWKKVFCLFWKNVGLFIT